MVRRRDDALNPSYIHKCVLMPVMKVADTSCIHK